jgi:hypothetical protein
MLTRTPLPPRDALNLERLRPVTAAFVRRHGASDSLAEALRRLVEADRRLLASCLRSLPPEALLAAGSLVERDGERELTVSVEAVAALTLVAGNVTPR